MANSNGFKMQEERETGTESKLKYKERKLEWGREEKWLTLKIREKIIRIEKRERKKGIKQNI